VLLMEVMVMVMKVVKMMLGVARGDRTTMAAYPHKMNMIIRTGTEVKARMFPTKPNHMPKNIKSSLLRASALWNRSMSMHMLDAITSNQYTIFR